MIPVTRLDLPTVGGVLLIVVGLFAIVDPSVVQSVAVPSDLMDLVGVLALLGGLVTARLTMDADNSTATVTPPETKAELPVPGEDVDTLLATMDENPLGALDEHAEIRDRLTAIAVALLADRYGLRESAAREALETGVWTDDSHAAAFFIGEYPEWAPLRLQVREWATFIQTPPSMQAEHAVTELLAIADGEHERLERAPVDQAGETTGQEPGVTE